MFEFLHSNKDGTTIDVLVEHIARSLNVTEMAIEKAIDMTAKMIAKSEFKEYRKVDGKVQEHKDHLYYLLNVKPNSNELATDFWRRAIRRLIRYGECLILPLNEGFYIADSFIKDDVILYETTFKNVNIGNLSFKKVFTSNEVIYLKNRNKKIMGLMKSFDKAYAEMLVVAMGNYKIQNAMKFKLKLPTTAKIRKGNKVVSGNEYAKTLENELSSDQLKVIMMGMDVNLEQVTAQSKTPEDIMKLENHIKETIAFMFDIPIDVFIGKTTEKSNAMNDMITFNIDPFIEILNDGINACVFDEKEYLDGEMVLIDKTSLKHVDILDVAVQLDKLFSDGFSHNEIKGFIGLNRTEEAWADEHYVTKNYENVKGGEKSE